MLLIAHNWRPVIQTELVRQQDLMRADALLPEHDIKPPAMATNGAELLSLLWRLNCRTRGIDHLLEDRDGGFWRWVRRGVAMYSASVSS